MSLCVLNVAYPLAPVSADTVGGAEQVLAALDRALVERGHTSLVIACEGSRVAGTLLPVPAETGVLDEAARARAQARHRHAIEAARRRWPIDVVHLHGIDFSAYLPDQGPTLVTLHLPLDWYPPEALRPARDDLWLHAVSPEQHRTAPPGAILHAPIRNGVDVALLSRRHARRRFALVLSRICPEKGVHLALEAARAAEIPLFVGGQVYEYAEHRRYFHAEIEPRLDRERRFLGPLGFLSKRRFLNAAKCLVIPSLAAETSSLVALEALACGTLCRNTGRSAASAPSSSSVRMPALRVTKASAQGMSQAGLWNGVACGSARQSRHHSASMDRGSVVRLTRMAVACLHGRSTRARGLRSAVQWRSASRGSPSRDGTVNGFFC